MRKVFQVSRRLFFTLLGIVLFVSACTRQKDTTSTPKAGTGEGIVFGFQPNEAQHDLERFTSELSKRIGVQVTHKVATNYAQLVDMFKKGDVDFVFFSPINFIQAEQNAGAKVLLKVVYGQAEFYYSALVSKQDSNIQKISDLKSKKIAFVDQKSASGYLYPRLMLRQAGLSDQDYEVVYSGTHQKSVALLKEGAVDVIGVWAQAPEMNAGAWNSDADQTMKAKVLQYSAPIPNDAFAVRSDFYVNRPEMIYRVMEAMISLSDQSLLKEILTMDGLTTATSRHYDTVRELLKTFGDQL